MNLTLVQRDVLTALIKLRHQEGQAIKSEEIAEFVGRRPGIIRNLMQSLRTLKLVVSATEIILDKIMLSAQRCSGLIRIIGDIRDFEIGDDVEAGPTPVTKLYIRGKVVGPDNTTRGLVLNVTEIISIPGHPVKKFAAVQFESILKPL